MKDLNKKNKIYIILFAVIIISIIGILVVSMKLSNENKSINVYDISKDSVVFDSNTTLVDTSLGGTIEAKWNKTFSYNNGSVVSDLGKSPVVYEKDSDTIKIFGNVHKVNSSGNIESKSGLTDISNTSNDEFYKLNDRVYLIISNEIYNESKTIYAKKYLIVYIDKQGNASILNDAINIKTINPLKLTFGSFTFDIANERLINGQTNVDLKLIDGSTNEYDSSYTIKLATRDDLKYLAGAYNKLVNDFNQYTDDLNQNVLANIKANSTTNYYINNINTKIDKTAKEAAAAAIKNKTTIFKKVSLRGAVSYPTYIDVAYSVTDPEDKYQAVYLLVSGYINGTNSTIKVVLDKYDTMARIRGLEPKNEYTISLGYIELVDEGKEQNLYDNIEDVINIRTSGVPYELNVDKISSGYVYFTFKMSEIYAFESGEIAFLEDGEEVKRLDFTKKDILSKNGFQSKFKINTVAEVYSFRIYNAIYNKKASDIKIEKKFTYGL